MPKCKKILHFFKSTSFLTKNVSKESTDSGENGKHNYMCHNIPVQWQSHQAYSLFSNDSVTTQC